MPPRYQKIICGNLKPRFTKTRNKFDKIVETAEKHYHECNICGRYSGKTKATTSFSKDENIITLFVDLGSKYSKESPSEITRIVRSKSKSGLKSIVFSGNSLQNIPFVVNVLKKLETNIAIFIMPNILCPEAAKIAKPLIDVWSFRIDYFDPICARHAGMQQNYVEEIKKLIEFAETEGDLLILLSVRHGHIECDAKSAIDWLATENILGDIKIEPLISPILDENQPELGKKTTIREFNEVMSYARSKGLNV